MSEGNLCCQACNVKLPVMKRCTRCLGIYYCSRECQIKDWSRHKGLCLTRTAEPKPPTAKDVIKNPSNSDPGDTNGTKKASNANQDLDKCSTNTQRHNVVEAQRQQCGPGFTYVCNDKIMYDLPHIDSSLKICNLVLRHNKRRHTIAVQPSWTGEDTWRFLSSMTCIPREKLQLIHKGRRLTPETTREYVQDKAVFLAVGEPALPQGDVSTVDIEVMMRQLNVERNSAIKALKKNGNLVDAMLDIGGK